MELLRRFVDRRNQIIVHQRRIHLVRFLNYTFDFLFQFLFEFRVYQHVFDTNGEPVQLVMTYTNLLDVEQHINEFLFTYEENYMFQEILELGV